MVDTWSEVLVQTWLMKRNIIKEHKMFYLEVHVHCSVPQHPMCQLFKISTTWCAPRSRELFVVCCYADVSP